MYFHANELFFIDYLAVAGPGMFFKILLNKILTKCKFQTPPALQHPKTKMHADDEYKVSKTGYSLQLGILFAVVYLQSLVFHYQSFYYDYI